MEIIHYFLLACAISFGGSCQPGPVNMAVLLTSSEKQFRKAFFIAVGGSIPESIYAFVAVYASSIIIGYQDFLKVLSQGFAIAFIGFGLYLFVRKAKLEVSKQKDSKNGMLLGFLISAVNPQLILFWIAVITSMEMHEFHLTSAGILAQGGFLIGTSVGAFIVHLALVIACRKYHQSNVLTLFSTYSNKIVGCVFAILGLSQLLLG